MKIYTEFPQRGDEWRQVRLGKFTGTDFQTVANGRKDTIKRLCQTKAAEIITGTWADKDYKNFHMDRGSEIEPEAMFYFEMETGRNLKEVAFVEMDEYTGVSPDGLNYEATEDGYLVHYGWEGKGKDLHTHLDVLLNGTTAYKWQIQGGLFVTKAPVWFFTSYNSSYPEKGKTFIEEVYPDEESFEKIQHGLDCCIPQVEKIVEEYKKKYGN